MSLVVTIFAIVFFTQLISWVGQSVLLERVYSVYLRIFHAQTAAKQRKLKDDLLNTKNELMRTSAQDHFAKWAKLRRSVDKGLADLEKLNGEISSKKTKFSLKFNSFVWILTTGLQLVVTFYYRRTPVFYVPPGWFGPVTWWLAFPFAPKGSVSVGIWQMACRRVVAVLEGVVKELWASYYPEQFESDIQMEDVPKATEGKKQKAS